MAIARMTGRALAASVEWPYHYRVADDPTLYAFPNLGDST